MRSKRLKEATGSRRHRKRPEVEAVLEEYRKSGLTQRMFARREGIGVSTLQLWLRQTRAGSRGTLLQASRKGSKESPAPALSLLEVELSGTGPNRAPGEARGYEIELRAGSRLRVPSGFGEEEVRRLLALLKEVE